MDTAILHQPVLRRFAWKEYRMLRGFWLAVLGLGFLEQWVSTLLVDDSRILPGWLLASAWGAAALYAVGAAVTLFGAENEERTRTFLQVLPRSTGPLVAGKLAVALASSLFLAVFLSVTGWLLAGRVSPPNIDVRFALGIGGVAILETTAWGMLFSIQWRQPLLAAVAALAAASFGAQLAILALPGSHITYAVSSYYDAIPVRLAICFAVFAADLLLVRRWLEERPVRGVKPVIDSPSAQMLSPSASQTVGVTVVKVFRSRMLWRLVWQAWREAWRPMLLAIPVAIFFMFSISLPLVFGINQDIGYDPLLELMPLLSFLFLPALWGTLVFRADHKGQHRLFLATHAARPRVVWLSRQIVWLGSTMLPMSVVSTLFTVIFMHDGRQTAIEMGISYPRALVSTWCAFITAYAVGQLCSLLLKQEVLAGFLALLLSVVLVAWSGVVFYWGLPSGRYVLLLGLGAMLATWLRIPDWLTGRRGWPGWLKPASPLVLALVLIALSLPAVRMEQVGGPRPHYPFLAKPLAASVQEYESHRAEGQETALEYERLWGQLKTWPNRDELKVDGKTRKEWGLDQIPNDDVLTDEFAVERGYGAEEFMGGEFKIDPQSEKEHSERQWKDVLNDRFRQEEKRLYLERNEPVLRGLMDVSQQPYCRITHGAPGVPEYSRHFGQLLWMDAMLLTEAGQLDAAMDRLKAWVRFKGHLTQNQLSAYAVWYQDSGLFNVLGYDGILAWAQHPDQTSERLRKAIAELSETFTYFPGPREAILADYEHIRDVINEKELPSTWGGEKKNRTTAEVLAYLANKLPWERRRALVALDCLATNNLNYVDAVAAQTILGLPGQGSYPDRGQKLRQLLRYIDWMRGIPENEIAFEGQRGWFRYAHALNVRCQSSALVAQEFGRPIQPFYLLHGYVTEETRRRVLLVQIALLAYRLDHDKYPETLDDLTPEYLYHYYYYDPFAGEYFGYHPHGLAWPIVNGRYEHDFRIEAGTPLLWSVGVANCRLQEARSESDEIVLQREPTETNGAWNNENLMFPLPK